jgi:hypothetical protein
MQKSRKRNEIKKREKKEKRGGISCRRRYTAGVPHTHTTFQESLDHNDSNNMK